MTNPIERTSSKEAAIAAIADARANLDLAVAELQKLPALDPNAIAFSAHALHNYLAVASATIELLILQLKDYPDKEIHTWLEGLLHATDLISTTVNQLFTASVDSVPRMMFENVDFVKLVQRACHFYQRIADKKEIQITFASFAKAPYVWTDRVATGAILDNLLSNAVKYSEPGKTVRVTIEEELGYLNCNVQDQGPGISEEDQVGLFQRGGRRSSNPTAGESSSGYGLAVARELVIRLGGKIWCHSTLGQGARFSFSLPSYKPK